VELPGYDIFDEIRSRPQFDAIPIVAVSAADPTIAVPKARKKGFSGFISKPVDDELFPKQLRELIDGKPVWYTG
jgi:CheY-like chemotaxis protein